ncbi:hypothetical protein UT300015_16960 [Clostridium tertium]
MKKLILNTLSWILVVSLLSFYLHNTLNFPLINYIFILGISLIALGIIAIIRPILQKSKLTNSIKNTINFINIESNSISICLAGVISLLACILL